MSFEITVNSNAAEAAAQLRKFPAAMVEGIARVLDRQNELTLGQVQARKLSKRGPTTLGVVTNRLRGSANRTPAHFEDGEIVSALGSNVEYAAAHEFGFDGPVAVPAHTRRRFQTTSGGSTFDSKSGRIRKAKPQRVETGSVSVRAHSRHMKLPARRMFASTVEEREPNYREAISSALLRAWQGGAS